MYIHPNEVILLDISMVGGGGWMVRVVLDRGVGGCLGCGIPVSWYAAADTISSGRTRWVAAMTLMFIGLATLAPTRVTSP